MAYEKAFMAMVEVAHTTEQWQYICIDAIESKVPSKSEIVSRAIRGMISVYNGRETLYYILDIVGDMNDEDVAVVVEWLKEVEVLFDDFLVFYRAFGPVSKDQRNTRKTHSYSEYPPRCLDPKSFKPVAEMLFKRLKDYVGTTSEWLDLYINDHHNDQIRALARVKILELGK